MVRKFFMYVSVVICATLMFAPSVFAAGVNVGDNSGTDVVIATKISSMTCDYSNGREGRLTLVDVDGVSHRAVYRTSDVSAAWCTTRLELVANNLLSATPRLIDVYDAANLRFDGATGTVVLSNLATGGGGDSSGGGETECRLSILPDSWCGEDGIWLLLQLVLNVMTAGVGILATIGLVISGIQWGTAIDKEQQIVMAKSRIFNIVIGLVMWALMWLVLSWLIPGFEGSFA